MLSSSSILDRKQSCNRILERAHISDTPHMRILYVHDVLQSPMIPEQLELLAEKHIGVCNVEKMSHAVDENRVKIGRLLSMEYVRGMHFVH